MRILHTLKRWAPVAVPVVIASVLIFFSGSIAGSMYAKMHYDRESQQRRAILEQCLINNENLGKKVTK